MENSSSDGAFFFTLFRVHFSINCIEFLNINPFLHFLRNRIPNQRCAIVQSRYSGRKSYPLYCRFWEFSDCLIKSKRKKNHWGGGEKRESMEKSINSIKGVGRCGRERESERERKRE